MIYLDSAATTLQKPPAVARAVFQAIGSLASVGRGGHGPGMRAAEAVFQCRQLAARIFDVPDPDHVVFTFNATHALNVAIHTLVEPGSAVLISGYEHNAVTRPLAAIPHVDIRVASAPVFDRAGILEAFRRELDRGGVNTVVCNHVSNVFGFILPVEEIAQLCAEKGVPFVLDASQSAGTLPVKLGALHAAYIAMPGHKGLYGPQGTGLLLCGEDSPRPLLYGGTGSASLLQTMPDTLPDRLEAGTHNVCGIAGLLEGLRFVQRRGPGRIAAHEWQLCRRMMDGLASLSDVEVFRGERTCQSGLCSFRTGRMDCEVLGDELSKRGIAVRAGLHCAPLAHRSAGTVESGTVRLSFSAFNTRREVDETLSVLRTLLR